MVNIMKEYYSSEEFRKKIKQSIIRNGEELKNNISIEEKYTINTTNTYV